MPGVLMSACDMCRAAHGSVGSDGSLQAHALPQSFAGTCNFARGFTQVAPQPNLDQATVVRPLLSSTYTADCLCIFWTQ